MIRVVVLFAFSLNLFCQDWKVQFFHDEDRKKFVVNDFKMLDLQRGLAVGFIEEDQKTKPMMVITANGGKTWTMQPLEQIGISLFFLDDSTGYMVADGGIWRTDEGGRGWTRVSRQKGLERVWFLDREHGFGVGARKTMMETLDGGKTWKPVEAARRVDAREENTRYNWIQFATPKRGIVVGHSQPTRLLDPEWPDWMDVSPKARAVLPSLTIFIQTTDGGQTWKASTSSLFGQITRFYDLEDGTALALFQYRGSFNRPSDLVRLSKDGKSETVFGPRDCLLTDVFAAPNGVVYAAGIQAQGAYGLLPVDSKVKVFASRDLQEWREMKVDYRALATRVTFSGRDAENVWLATDTGMILRLAGY